MFYNDDISYKIMVLNLSFRNIQIQNFVFMHIQTYVYVHE